MMRVDDGLLVVDQASSTVMLVGRRFPAVLAICPPEECAPRREDLDRTLGGGSRFSTEALIPAENGLLFGVEPMGEDRPGLLSLKMEARTCEQVPSEPDYPWIWLPCPVSLVDGTLEVGWHGTWQWLNAEPDWVVETIDRLARKPFVQPSGPEVRLVHLAHFRATGHG